MKNRTEKGGVSKPDGWCAWHPAHGYSNDGYYWHKFSVEEMGPYWVCKPVFFVSPEEKARILTDEQVAWISKLGSRLYDIGGEKAFILFAEYDRLFPPSAEVYQACPENRLFPKPERGA